MFDQAVPLRGLKRKALEEALAERNVVGPKRHLKAGKAVGESDQKAVLSRGVARAAVEGAPGVRDDNNGAFARRLAHARVQRDGLRGCGPARERVGCYARLGLRGLDARFDLVRGEGVGDAHDADAVKAEPEERREAERVHRRAEPARVAPAEVHAVCVPQDGGDAAREDNGEHAQLRRRERRGDEAAALVEPPHERGEARVVLAAGARRGRVDRPAGEPRLGVRASVRVAAARAAVVEHGPDRARPVLGAGVRRALAPLHGGPRDVFERGGPVLGGAAHRQRVRRPEPARVDGGGGGLPVVRDGARGERRAVPEARQDARGRARRGGARRGEPRGARAVPVLAPVAVAAFEERLVHLEGHVGPERAAAQEAPPRVRRVRRRARDALDARLQPSEARR